jgi:hypothetical protein
MLCKLLKYDVFSLKITLQGNDDTYICVIPNRLGDWCPLRALATFFWWRFVYHQEPFPLPLNGGATDAWVTWCVLVSSTSHMPLACMC